jgi:DNA-binding transcriptional regulator YhcF (GntR family)
VVLKMNGFLKMNELVRLTTQDVGKGIPITDRLIMEELEKVQELESKIANFIEFTNTEGKDDKQIYEMVKKYLEENK